MADKKVLIFKRKNQIITALMHDKRLVQVHVSEQETKSLIGNIYIGRVQNIVKNIEAAFVEIDKGLVCYLPLTDLKHPIFTNRTGQKWPDKPLCIGDELLVQVTRDALKTKQPAVSTNLSIPGEYLVVSHGEQGVGISAKIKGNKRDSIKSFVNELYQDSSYKGFEEYGIVLRTNVSTLKEHEFEKIRQEMDQMHALYEQMLSIATYRPAFTKLFSKPDLYNLDQIYQFEYDEIITDQKDIFEALLVLQSQKKIEAKIRLYQDDNLSLVNLYGMESRLKEAVGPRIWLKSGGYLIIEPTEALTVIDVNTGKFDGKSVSMEDTVLKINQEAAIEAAHQLRVRNLSGIVIIDFINMQSDANKSLLLQTLHNAVAQDYIQTNVIGFTNLGLVEVTRKKKNKPLKDLLIL